MLRHLSFFLSLIGLSSTLHANDSPFPKTSGESFKSIIWVDHGEIGLAALISKLGYSDIKPISYPMFSLLCRDEICDRFMKIVRSGSRGISRQSWEESAKIQNKAADSELALPVYSFGSFENLESLEDPEDAETHTYFFMISLKGDIEYRKCHDKKRFREFFINKLNTIGVVHGDLETHANNFICYNDRSYLIDFDEGYDLSKLSERTQENLRQLESFCSIKGTSPGSFVATHLTLYNRFMVKRAASLGIPPMNLSLCYCRKRSAEKTPDDQGCLPEKRKIFGDSIPL